MDSADRQRLPLVLASGSPRRRDLLTRAGLRFEVIPADVAERPAAGESPTAMARRLAREKARAVAHRVGSAPPRLVLGADTVVVVDGQALGKPADADDAVRMLGRLAGRRHCVVTAVALVHSDSLAVRELEVTSGVRMRPATTAELRAYVGRGESLDKAGAYAAQGEGRRFIEAIEGSETNVIGLPLPETLGLIQAAGGGDAR